MYISMEKHFEKDFRRDPRHTQYLADTMNKKMPRMLDDVTRIDRAESDGNVLRMTYTILGKPKASRTSCGLGSLFFFVPSQRFMT